MCISPDFSRKIETPTTIVYSTLIMHCFSFKCTTFASVQGNLILEISYLIIYFILFFLYFLFLKSHMILFPNFLFVANDGFAAYFLEAYSLCKEGRPIHYQGRHEKCTVPRL